ncbi:MAG: MinD/ParA family protein [Planctomycetota bacterium]
MTDNGTSARVIAVTSGKGGVGKTNVAVNLAVSLRMMGKKVLLLDADVSLGNVDVLLGLSVRHDLRDVLLHDRELEQVVVEGPRGVKIMPAASGVEAMTRLSDQQVERFLDDFRRFCAPMDYVVVDTAPGVSPVVMNCLQAADDAVLVTNPEPTSLTDAYALLKVLYGRPGTDGKPVFVVMNQIDSKEEALNGFDRLRNAAMQFLGREIEYLGSVAWDDTVGLATRKQVDFLTHYSAAPCSRDVRKLAARLVSARQPGRQDMGRFIRSLTEGADE